MKPKKPRPRLKLSLSATGALVYAAVAGALLVLAGIGIACLLSG